MKRSFVFIWKPIDKYGTATERHNLITLSNATGQIGTDAKFATDLFCKQFGGLKKNEIICIQELDEKGKPIGEPITPMDNSNMVPVKHIEK